jgi:hypothetical protein
VATEPRRPLHLVWLIGLSASIYALNLAAVTAMQAAADTRAAGDRAPTSAALDILRTHDARTDLVVQRAAVQLQAGATTYADVGRTLADLEQRLAALDKSAGALKALPTTPNLRVTSAAPTVSSTTGASGARP